MTRIAEGRMIVKRLHVRIAPMRGEAIVREPEQFRQDEGKSTEVNLPQLQVEEKSR